MYDNYVKTHVKTHVEKAASPRSRTGRHSLVALVLCFAANTAFGACEEPVFEHAMPDGKSASESEMAQAQVAVKDYVSAGEAYIKCLEDNGSTNSPSYVKKRNSTIDGMEQVAAMFNRELRYYRKNS